VYIDHHGRGAVLSGNCVKSNVDQPIASDFAFDGLSVIVQD